MNLVHNLPAEHMRPQSVKGTAAVTITIPDRRRRLMAPRSTVFIIITATARDGSAPRG